jgi:hypothetical protein
MRRRGPVRVGGSVLVVSVLGKVSLDLTAAQTEPGRRTRVLLVNVFGIADVRLPANTEVSTIRVSLGRTRVARAGVLSPSPS